MPPHKSKPPKSTNTQLSYPTHTPLPRAWHIFTKSPSNSVTRVTNAPLATAESFFEYFALLDKPQYLGQKMELYIVQKGMILEDEKQEKHSDDDEAAIATNHEPEEPLQWSVRYGLRTSKANIEALWSDLVMAAIGETFPHSERIVAVSVTLLPLYGVVSLHVLDPELQLPVERETRKVYLEELVPQELVTVQWKTIFDFSENVKATIQV